MKILWGLLLSLCLANTALADNRVIARFAYEEAEAAFQRNDIPTTLSKLDEAERLFGTVNPPMLYLRIQARQAQLAKGPFLHDLYLALKKDTDRFIKNYGATDGTIDMARDVYRIAQEADARLQREKALIASETQSAEAGDLTAMRVLADRYRNGVGTPRDSAREKLWLGRLSGEQLKLDVAAANAGDITAMERMAQRFASGDGVKRDAKQAADLRNRIATLQAQRAEEQARRQAEQQRLAREAEARQKIDSISYFEYTGAGMKGLMGRAGDEFGAVTLILTTGPFVTAFGLMTDLLAAPTKITEVQKLKQGAVQRPAAWGNPESLMGRAAAQRNGAGLGEAAPPPPQ